MRRDQPGRYARERPVREAIARIEARIAELTQKPPLPPTAAWRPARAPRSGQALGEDPLQKR